MTNPTIIKSGRFNELNDEAVLFEGFRFGVYGWIFGVRENDELRGNPLRSKLFFSGCFRPTTSELAALASDYGFLLDAEGTPHLRGI